MFGAANQLVGALALIVVTSWLLSRHKSIKFTLLPSLFMLITTIGALVFQLIKSFKEGETLLFVIAIILLGLAMYMLLEIDLILFRALTHRKEKRKKQGYVKI